MACFLKKSLSKIEENSVKNVFDTAELNEFIIFVLYDVTILTFLAKTCTFHFNIEDISL